jgi:hypothetical protein
MYVQLALDAVVRQLVEIVDEFASEQGTWDVPGIAMLAAGDLGDTEAVGVALGVLENYPCPDLPAAGAEVRARRPTPAVRCLRSIAERAEVGLLCDYVPSRH